VWRLEQRCVTGNRSVGTSGELRASPGALPPRRPCAVQRNDRAALEFPSLSLGGVGGGRRLLSVGVASAPSASTVVQHENKRNELLVPDASSLTHANKGDDRLGPDVSGRTVVSDRDVEERDYYRLYDGLRLCDTEHLRGDSPCEALEGHCVPPLWCERQRGLRSPRTRESRGVDRVQGFLNQRPATASR
jgi:hypothetical protein